MTRRAVVSYAIGDTDAEKRRALKDGIRECATELISLGLSVGEVVSELEQVANDAEGGQLV